MVKIKDMMLGLAELFGLLLLGFLALSCYRVTGFSAFDGLFLVGLFVHYKVMYVKPNRSYQPKKVMDTHLTDTIKIKR